MDRQCMSPTYDWKSFGSNPATRRKGQFTASRVEKPYRRGFKDMQNAAKGDLPYKIT